MKLTTLRPRLAVAKLNRVKPLAGDAERLLGRTGANRRRDWLSRFPLCVLCQREGRIVEAAELDHIVPLWEGGAEADSNLQGLCVPHHRAKTAEEAGRRARM